MEEHELTAEGLVKPENAKKLGQFAGVDTILIGTLASMGDTVTLTVKGISTESSEVVAAGRMKFGKTDAIVRMLEESIRSDTSIRSARGAGGAQSAEGDAVATKEVGPLVVVLRDVSHGYVTVGRARTRTPMIECIFEFQNPNLKESVLVASNRAVTSTRSHEAEVRIGNHRGSLTDSSGRDWQIPPDKVTGIASIMCFEAKNITTLPPSTTVTQSNPSAIVDYLRTGNRYEFSGRPANGTNWAGAFTTIPPGERIRCTAMFVLQDFMAIMRNPDRTRADTGWPDSFQLDWELVVGNVVEGDRDTRRNLALRNLSFDKITLSADTTETSE